MFKHEVFRCLFFRKPSNINLFFSSRKKKKTGQNGHLRTSGDSLSFLICVYAIPSFIYQHCYLSSSWTLCFVWQLVIMQNMKLMESVAQCVIQVSPTVLHLITTTDADEVRSLKGSYDLSGFKLSFKQSFTFQLIMAKRSFSVCYVKQQVQSQ